MNECKIEKVCEGQCSECGKDRKGVRFSLPFSGDTAFLCWEHYRLLQESLKTTRVVREVVRTVEECPCCPCCCPHRRCGCPCAYRHRSGRAVCRSVTQTVGRSESRTEGVSVGRSTGTSDTCGGSGKSHGTTSTWSSQGEPLP